MERRVICTDEVYRILIIAVARFILAVEEYLSFINAAIQKSVYAASSGVMILAKLVDKVLFIDIVEIQISARCTRRNVFGIYIALCTVGKLHIIPLAV